MKVLNDVVCELLDKGYMLSFDVLEQVKFELNDDTAEQLPVADFSIDEIYRCREHQHDPNVVYVFAISSVKHNLKGIVINLITAEVTITWGDVYEKVKTACCGLISQRRIFKK